MKIACISDLHGNLIEKDWAGEGIDVILCAGDYTGMFERDDIAGQLGFFENQFCPWVRRILDTGTQFYYINGNHEVACDRLNINTDYNDVTQHCVDMRELTLYPGEENSVTIFGFPYTPTFGRWGFNRDDTEDDLGRLCEHILKCDILLTHGPPYGINDVVPGKVVYDHRREEFVTVPDLHVGSRQILKRVTEIRPKYVISGHVHSNYGQVEKDGIAYISCPLVDESYRIVRHPIILEI